MKTPFKIGLLIAPFTAAMLVFGVFLLLPIFSLQARPLPPARPGARASGASCNRLLGSPLVECAAAAGQKKDVEMIEMEVRDVIPLTTADTHAVVLVSKDRGTVLPIFVDEGAAVAIAFRLAHREPPHPLAHDLLDRVVTELGGTVTEVRIDDVEDQIYQGRVFISQGQKHLQLNARPSDSISMALANGAKIFASKKVLAEAGITREEIDRLREHNGVGGSGPAPSAREPKGKGSEIRL